MSGFYFITVITQGSKPVFHLPWFSIAVKDGPRSVASCKKSFSAEFSVRSFFLGHIKELKKVFQFLPYTGSSSFVTRPRLTYDLSSV